MKGSSLLRAGAFEVNRIMDAGSASRDEQRMLKKGYSLLFSACGYGKRLFGLRVQTKKNCSDSSRCDWI